VLGCAAVLLVGLLAFQSPGYAGSSVQAATRNVWVTNGPQFLLGRINRQIDELDSAAALSSSDFDVVQQGRLVFAVDNAAHQLRRLDPATVSLSAPLLIPRRAVVALGGDVLAIADRDTGRVWTLQATATGVARTGDPVPDAGRDITAQAPTATVAPGVVLAVAADGTVAATAPGRDSLTVIPPPGDDAAGPGATPPVAGVQRPAAPASGPQVPGAGTSPAGPGADVELARRLSTAGPADPTPVAVTMVGSTPVVLDRPAGDLLVRDRVLPLPHAGASGNAVLQQPGPAADAVLLATDTALLRIPLAGGAVQTFASGTTGVPAAPVWLADCAHAAWSGSGPTYLSWCGSVPAIRPIPAARTGQAPGPGATQRLVFRVNGSEIVLNDVATGDSWLLDRTMTVVNDWSQVAPPREQNSDQVQDRGDENTSEQVTLSRTSCTGPVSAPTAKDDSFGLRAGRPAILPVMANDATTDCAAVVVDTVSGLPEQDGTVAVVQGGRALQVTVPAGFTGFLPPLTYRISDGAGHTLTASVHLRVVPDDEYPPPVRLRGSATMVGVGGAVSDNVLADWVSPAGDPLWLTAASAQGQGLAVGFEPGGTITVHDTGTGGPGKRTVTFALTDGVSVQHGTLTVDVVAADDAAPIASPVFAETVVGRPVTIDAMSSVLVPGTDPARLAAVRPAPGTAVLPTGVTAVAHPEDGTVTVAATAAGDYRIGYQVAAGPLAATGVIRVRVADGSPAPPVAVTDVGYLAPDRQLRMDLTGNDIAGGSRVLAVQQITLDPGSPLLVTLSDMHVAHISAIRPLPAGGSWFSYTVSDGSTSALGWVHVVPVPAMAGQGPVASPAQMTVRAGDAGTLPIGRIAQDRDGNAMTVQVTGPLPDGQGLLFAAGDAIRYLAPEQPPAGQVQAVYTVTDTAGLSDAAPLRITVLPRDGNRKPADPPVTQARVFAGGSVTVPLPLDGIDPDGDWVTVHGIDDPGRLGQATLAGPSAVRYTALDTPGPDSFTYTADDHAGGRVTGRVDVVVVPPPTVAEPPVAPDLKVSVIPGRTVGVDVLAAVSDPGNLPVRFAGGPGSPAAAVTVPAGAGLTAAAQDGILAITAGRSPAVVPVGYTVVNARGLSASGVVTVTITPDAAAVPPTASDVIVDADMVSGDSSTATVDVSAHVTNPGGMPDDLVLDLPAADPAGARKSGDRKVTVTLTSSRQVIAYQVSNEDRLTASAFIVVPTEDELRARSGSAQPEPFHPKTDPLVVDAGSTALVDVRKQVTGAGRGRTVSVPANAQMSATAGSVTRLDGQRLRWTVPADAPAHALLRVQVTDGQGPAVTVSIPATIRPVVPPPPTFQSTALQVAAGGTASLDLAGLVTPGAPNQHLTFAEPTGQGEGVSAALSGSTLTVSAAVTTRRATRVDLGVSVSDGVHPAVPATVRVTVVASTAPLARVPDSAVEAVQGESVPVDVLARATNPLPGSGPLRVVGAEVISGTGTVRYTADGTVTVTPGAGQVGALQVRVLVQDATGDPDRTVTARLTATVAGPPGQVTGVDVVRTGDGWVVLKWGAPADNGRRIEYYLVSSGDYQHRCDPGPTQCRLPGLTNDVGYRFTVTAHNHLGDSPPSAASPEVRPDVAPAAPKAATLTAGDRSITATWRRPADRGSPIRGYLVSISPAPLSGAATVTVTSGTTHTFQHLVNGTSYQVTVVAQNRSGSDSDPSPAATAVPAGRPAPPAAPALSYDQARRAVVIAWSAPDGNGDDDLFYTVSWTADDGTSGAWTLPTGAPRSTVIERATLGVTYSATVTAINDIGPSRPSDRGRVRASTQVGHPTDVTASPTGSDNQVTVDWTPPPFSGWDIRGYDYQIDGGDWTPIVDVQPTATGLTAPITDEALTNGRRHTVAIRACTVQGPNTCGDGSSGDQVVPYGEIGTPAVTVAAHSGKSVTFSWNSPADNGLGPYSYLVTVGSATTTTTEPSILVRADCGDSVTITVLAVDSQGHQGPASQPVEGTADPCAVVYPLRTVDARGGAPTFPHYSNMAGDGTPKVPYNATVGIQCWSPARVIASDGGDGWYQIAPGYPAAGRWSPANNFQGHHGHYGDGIPHCG
jgi:hypothetical protein